MALRTNVRQYFRFQNRNFTIPQFLTYRDQLGALKGTSSTNEIVQAANNSYKYLSDVVELLQAQTLGASQITSVAGKGFQPDFVRVDETGNLEFGEGKNIAVITTSKGLIAAKKKISLGSVGISKIREIAIENVVEDKTTGKFYSKTEKFALENDEQQNFSETLFLASDKKRWLVDTATRNDEWGKAATQIIKNITLKSSKIYVSTVINGKAFIKQVGWTWNDILKNPQAKIVVTKTETKKGETVISLDVEFSPSLVTKALQKASNTKEFLELNDTINKKISQILEESLLAKQSFKATQKAIKELNNRKEGTFEVSYEKGSVKVYTATITANSSKKTSVFKTNNLSVISDTQLTALVQQITENKMPRGPLRGPPLSSTVLTYRSGQFVDSIKVIQDMRQQLIKYYYAPNYRVHEKRGARAPRFLLQASIREAVKQVYGTQFRIIRGF